MCRVIGPASHGTREAGDIGVDCVHPTLGGSGVGHLPANRCGSRSGSAVRVGWQAGPSTGGVTVAFCSWGGRAAWAERAWAQRLTAAVKTGEVSDMAPTATEEIQPQERGTSRH
ncbi:hypothetical protein NDU88_002481 [Pleurodeles waltl]|uniref:Uncharacterized protein n=1 Tax=Pleurodeles waltl TaxID=8319 RepID=A0AAV7P6W4_PLEWA|nr:hypothetical protein NDU88_002481 [Pleurodeles waltl]